MAQKQNVLYILGAGFSAPLGLPVMSNFISKSRDMVEESTDNRFDYFQNVYDNLDRLAKIKHYMDSDQLYLEEVLSILEMESYVKKEEFSEEYTRFIADVIKYYTPKNETSNLQKIRKDWSNSIFGNDVKIIRYGKFVANLFHLQITERRIKDLDTNRKSVLREFSGDIVPSSTEYSIISLNYDMVIENYIKMINSTLLISIPYSNNEFINRISLDLFKIHGTIEPLNIVFPTWNKTNNKSLQPVWQKAYYAITKAKEIRILGYSLPPTDNYIQYLLKIGIRDNSNLQKIDVICKDDNKEVESRYKNIFNSSIIRFKNALIEDYLQIAGISNHRTSDEKTVVEYASLEKGHESFFEQ